MFIYTLRNLSKVPVRTLQLVLGSFVVMLLFFAAYAFENGMETGLQANGDSQNVILLGTGSEESVERSEISLSAIPSVQSISGLKKQFSDVAISPEVHYNTIVEINGEEQNTMVRGVRYSAFSVYKNVQVMTGNFPRSGEMLVGRLAATRMGIDEKLIAVGKVIVFEKQEFVVSGIFAAPGSVMESELWINLGDINALTRRDTISCIVVRVADADFSDIDLFCKQRLDLQLTAIPEMNYYDKQNEFYQPIKVMAWLTAVLIALGALLGSMNTFYAAVIARKAEFAVLQVIGFSRLRLTLSLLCESLFFHLIAYFLAAVTTLTIFTNVHLNFGNHFFRLMIHSTELFHLLLLSVFLSMLVVFLPTMFILTLPLRESLRE